MRGYKGMNADMTCRGFKFEVGKEYTVRGNIKLCENGFHFCQSLEDVFFYYPPEWGSRYFVVEAAGNIMIDGDKAVAKTLRIVQEVDDLQEKRRALWKYCLNLRPLWQWQC